MTHTHTHKTTYAGTVPRPDAGPPIFRLRRPPTREGLRRLKVRLSRAGVTQTLIAERAKVTRPHVCHVLAGRIQSYRVLDIARELLASAREGKTWARSRASSSSSSG